MGRGQMNPPESVYSFRTGVTPRLCVSPDWLASLRGDLNRPGARFGGNVCLGLDRDNDDDIQTVVLQRKLFEQISGANTPKVLVSCSSFTEDGRTYSRTDGTKPGIHPITMQRNKDSKQSDDWAKMCGSDLPGK